MPNSGGSPPARTGGTGPARSSGVRPPLGLGRLRSRQRDWDKPRGSGRFKLDHPRCRFQPQHEDFRQHGTASLVRPFDVGDALPVQNRMLRPAVWPRTCKHFIITVSSGFCRHVGGRPHNRPLCYAWRQNMAGCLPRGRDTGLKLGLNLLGDFLEISACGSTAGAGRAVAQSARPAARRDRRLSPEVLKSIRRKLGVAHRVLDVLVPEPSLQRPGVVAGVG